MCLECELKFRKDKWRYLYQTWNIEMKKTVYSDDYIYPIEFWIYIEYFGHTEVIARYLINNGFLWRDETCIFIVIYSILET